MPLFWRYLIKNYLAVFALAVFAFIAILVTSRLEEIAHFASFGADVKLVILFALLQIPYILPIAIPVACLISSILLMQRLSLDHELTALRSAGFSLKEIITPLLVTSALIAFFNFYTVSELATLSHLKANLLKSELRSVNPLLLLHNRHLMQTKGAFYDVLGASKMGQSAESVVIALPDEKRKGLNLILAGQLVATDREFDAKNLALITPLKWQNGVNRREILLENISTSTSATEDFAHLIQKKVSTVAHDNLSMSLLLLRLDNSQEELLATKKNAMTQKSFAKESFANDFQPLVKSLHKSIRLIYTEIARRLSAGIAPFSLTLLGLAFGIGIGRLKTKFSLAFPVGLAALYLICFFAAKSLNTQVGLAYGLYLVPHALIIFVSLRKIDSISHGKE